MSPEQARGKGIDKRTDIFSFGAVLYEMLTGRRAFAGEDVSDVLAAVIRSEPEWKALPADVPPSVVKLLRRCLTKDRKNRLRDIADAGFEIQEILAESTGVFPQQPLAVTAPSRAREKVAWGVGILVAVLVTGIAVWSVMRAEPPAETIRRFPLTLPPGDALSGVSRHVVALSPDGTRFVYAANEQFYLREMDQLEPAPIRGTDGGREPFFSPGGQWVGFWANGNLRKVSVTGGAPVSLCECGNPYGASWGADDTIVFGQGPAGILRVSTNGGTPEVLIPMDSEKGERGHGPQMLPDGRTVLFTLSTTPSWDESQIVTQSLETGERRVLIEGGRDARYVPTGHLVYALAGTLLAVPFDLERLEVTGDPVPVVEGVGRARAGAAHASFSDSGSLVYVPESSLISLSFAFARELVRVDREGNASLLTETLGEWETPRFSPDGQRLAVRKVDETGQQDVWLLELSRGTLTRLTFEGGHHPLWSPHGERVLFTLDRVEGTNIFSQPADGSGSAEQLTTGPGQRYPAAITSDGKTLIFRQGGDTVEVLQPSLDIGMVRLEGESEPEMLLDTSFDEHTPKLSPDDRWLAYVSNESGRDEIFVTRFPTGGKWQISTEGGREPMWSRNGLELFYRNGEKMMAVDVSAGPGSAGKPTLLFEGPYDLKIGSGVTNYDVTPDGQGFVMIRAPERPAESSGPPQQINVVLNWFEELKRLVPTE